MKKFKLEKDYVSLPFLWDLLIIDDNDDTSSIASEDLSDFVVQRLALVKTRFNGYDNWSRLTGATISPLDELDKNRKYKYISYKKHNRNEFLMFIFSADLIHKDVADVTMKVSFKNNLGMTPVSAGFCNLLSATTYGESETLNLKCNADTDSVLLNEILRSKNES